MLNALNEIELIKPVIIKASEKFILPRFQNLKDKEIMKKGRHNETVTIADVEASFFILDFCKKRFPGSFTEESINPGRFGHDVIWSIYPVDGTDEFKQGKRGFVVQASLLRRRGKIYMPVAGIIYAPLERKFLYATENEGPFIDDGKIRKVKPQRQGKMKIIATQREVDPSKDLDLFYEMLREKGYKIKVVLTGGAGSVIFDMFTEKSGAGPNLYVGPKPYSSEWDMSPAYNMTYLSGGWMSDLEGSEFTFNRKNVKNEKEFVVCIGHDKKDIIGAISEFGVQKLLRF